MSVKQSEEKIHLSNIDQVASLLPLTSSSTIGLEFLRTIDQLYVSQRPSLSEVIFGIASESKFDIYDDKNVRILQALETSTFFQRFCCTSKRCFQLNIMDNNNQNIMLIKREFKCCSGCCWCAGAQCCSQEVTVESPPGTFIGTVSQQGSYFRSIFAIKDEQDNHILTLRSPLVICDGGCSCCCENKFVLIGTDGETEIGAIHKRYRGYLHEVTTSADAFSLTVPMDLDVKIKALSLAALFLIEYMLFSVVSKNN
ncbi:unnamed protein product [Rotaria socialis]|uniref:Phospholipid scramblase n=2 Tax=Rotaria socialis TaxID=392032 RepID=A0A821I8W3_9BILA|nr:unnamed protein product [Rotaria socialis]CAF3388013.1 unnamed protein product [Rotaria socialis]CAF3464835.1 unnamed protein product [Rotaria socialis]CAF3548876.1 unnamed protein product [Rotaria socialis]CAF4280950.1 unnamed protein product [Rotaria socialis]